MEGGVNGTRHRPPRAHTGERLLAWIYTGPIGHLYGAVADISVLWVRWVVSLAVARLRRLAGRGAA